MYVSAVIRLWAYLVQAFKFLSNDLKIGYLDLPWVWCTITAMHVGVRVCMCKCLYKSKVQLFDVWIMYGFLG